MIHGLRKREHVKWVLKAKATQMYGRVAVQSSLEYGPKSSEDDSLKLSDRNFPYRRTCTEDCTEELRIWEAIWHNEQQQFALNCTRQDTCQSYQ